MAIVGSRKKKNYQPVRICNLPMGIIRVKDSPTEYWKTPVHVACNLGLWSNCPSKYSFMDFVKKHYLIQYIIPYVYFRSYIIKFGMVSSIFFFG
jgi:hypothetical protein